MAEGQLKPLRWIGSSRVDLKAMSDEVQDEIGFDLYHAQLGNRPPNAKVLKGFGGGVLELIEHDAGGTYRAVYTVRFIEAVYVLHVFQKKSKHGIKTPKHEIELIRSRLAIAEALHKESQNAI
ncbi:MAG TPA: type II toxin-antitoxin system RelE/ParE family toxin [Tepidisphaeraceae bacterium]|jgi:phage-related protein|nr:type II toxin-antitoxin system RelE/ParE family toxin [Tepidisphaeraceae bacterium]